MHLERLERDFDGSYPAMAEFIATGRTENLEGLIRECGEVKSALVRARIDPLTQAVNRVSWHQWLYNNLLMLCPELKGIDDLDDFEAAMLLRRAGDLLGKESVIVIYMDIALLNLANKDKHRHGDALIKLVANNIRKHLLFTDALNVDGAVSDCVCTRLSGDEFAIFLFNIPLELIERRLRNFTQGIQMDFESDPNVPAFVRYGIVPRADAGTASLKEACAIVSDILHGGDIARGGKSHRDLLVDTLKDLADIRAGVNKGLEHIQLVVSLINGFLLGDRKRYHALRPYVLKGTLGIGRIDLAQLVFSRIFGSESGFRKLLLSKVFKKLTNEVGVDELDRLILERALDVDWLPEE